MNRFRLTSVCVLIFLFALAVSGFAAEPEENDYYTRTWMTDEGLPHNLVTHLLQDKTGYIWVGTSGGLARFDGREFKIFNLPPELEKKGFNIRGLAELADGSLLVLLPDQNVALFRNGQFSIHPVTASLAGKAPTDVFVEPSNAIWIGTADGALFRWENGQSTQFGKAEGINRRAPVFSFATDRKGRVWVASASFLGYYEHNGLVPFPHAASAKLLIAPARSGGIWILSDNSLAEITPDLVLVPHPEVDLPVNALPRQILEDREHGVWIATRRLGLYRVAAGRLKHVAFPNDFVLAIMEDHEGDLWAATEGSGVSILRRRFCTLFGQDDGLPQFTSAVAPDPKGGVWLANRSAGISHFRPGQVEPLAPSTGLNVGTVSTDAKGTLWIGAGQGLYRWSPDSAGSIEKIDGDAHGIRSLFCARDGTVWYADSRRALHRWKGGELYSFSKDDAGYADEQINCFAEDAQGGVWIGAASGAVRRYYAGKFTSVLPAPELPVLPIHALHFDSDGYLWIATSDGLILYANGRFHRFTLAEGLPDTLILQVLEDEDGCLWFGGSRGLFRISRKELLEVASGRVAKVEAVKFGKDDGVPNLSFVVGGAPLSTLDSDGRMWFSTTNGMVCVDPEKFASPVPSAHLVLQEVRIDGRALEPADQTRFPSGKHRLEFQFAALSYVSLDKIQLQHQLEGIDPDWVSDGPARAASYSSLPPGDYTLRFRERNDNASKKENANVFTFSITPAWWQTWWMRTGAGALVVFLSFALFRRYTHWQLKRELENLQREHALEKERARIARDLHDELGGSLTRIAFGVEQLKRTLPAAESGALLEQLSQRVRRHASDLQRVVWVESPKNDSLDRVCFFIARLAQDYFHESPIACTVRSPREVPPAPIPPEVQHHLIAIAKEAFNNVLKHSRATQVAVETIFDAPNFTLTIADNGVGFGPETEHDFDHNGLTNMRTRIAEVGGSFEIRSKPGAGTTVIVSWIHSGWLGRPKLQTIV